MLLLLLLHPAVQRELDMVISRLVIAYGLKEIAKDVLCQVLNTIQQNRPIFNPKIKKPIIIAKARFGRFYRKGHDKMWGRELSYLTP